MGLVSFFLVQTAAECLTEMEQRVTEYVAHVMMTHLVMDVLMLQQRTTILQQP
jgi:hypothetical protein